MFPFQGYVPSRTRPDHEPALLGGAVGGTVPESCSGSHFPARCACSPSPQSAPSGSSRRPHIWPHSAPAGQKQEQKEVTSQTSSLPNSPAQPTPSHLSVNTHPVSRVYVCFRPTPEDAYSPSNTRPKMTGPAFPEETGKDSSDSLWRAQGVTKGQCEDGRAGQL